MWWCSEESYRGWTSRSAPATGGRHVVPVLLHPRPGHRSHPPARDKQPRTAGHVAEVLLLWLLVITIGVGGVFVFLAHTVWADSTAVSIGWPTGNPFQTEVAVANLAIGVLGILCYWFRDNFWLATVIGNAVWQLGDAVIHIRQIIVANNWAPTSPVRS
jgi:hypothetical protein